VGEDEGEFGGDGEKFGTRISVTNLKLQIPNIKFGV
jgi:hypothetical protein